MYVKGLRGTGRSKSSLENLQSIKKATAAKMRLGPIVYWIAGSKERDLVKLLTTTINSGIFGGFLLYETPV